MRPAHYHDAHADHGASLIEALIAVALVCSTITGVAQLLLWSRRAVWSSGAETMAVVLAAQKLEQLRMLTWEIDTNGQPITDDSTDLSTAEPSAGGSGLQASALGTLHENTSGFVDYLDSQGVWRGTGAEPPAGSVFVRRWAILPFAADPLHTVVLHVIVLPVSDAVAADGRRSSRAAHQTTIRTRGVR